MKKIILALATAFVAPGSFAQNAYVPSVSQQTYTDLTDPSLFNNGAVWDYDYFDPNIMPFNFTIDGQEINNFSFFDDNFALLSADYNEDEGSGYFDVFGATAYIQDRTYNSGVSSSPLGYKVEGAEGNRILKLEVKNAGLEEDPEGDGHFYMNYQIWLYESDNSIEIHYGPSNITDISVLNDDEQFFTGLGGDTDAYIFYGDSAAPTYGEFTEETFPENVTMNVFPVNGTVYRLTPASTAGIDKQSTATIALYPNPASGVINLRSDAGLLQEYAIYDITGKLVMKGNMNNSRQINVEALAAGIYHIRLEGNNLKFIKG